jgi:hypothetical protein
MFRYVGQAGSGPLMSNVRPFRKHMNSKPTCLRFFILAAILLTSCATPQKQEQKPPPRAAVLSQDEAALVGRWVGRDSKGILGILEFSQNGDADLSMDGKSLKESVIGDSGTLSFKLNTGVIPQSLDLVARRNDGKVLSIPCIVEFVETETVMLRCSFSGVRPSTFEDADGSESIRLSRQK